MAAFTWHKLQCMACGRIERYRGKAPLGSAGHQCMSCHGPTRVTEIHWGREKYAQGRTGVDKLPRANPESKLGLIRTAAGGQAIKIQELISGKQRKMYLDMQTANAILTVYNALSVANQQKFVAYPISRMAIIAWKLLAKHNPAYMHMVGLSGNPRSLWKDRAVHFAVQYKTGRLCGTRLGRITSDPNAVSCLSCRLRLRRSNPSRSRYRYIYRPGVLDRVDPTTIVGRPIAPGSRVRILAKRPAGGKMIAGWGRTFAWIADEHGNEQIVYRRACCK